MKTLYVCDCFALQAQSQRSSLFSAADALAFFARLRMRGIAWNWKVRPLNHNSNMHREISFVSLVLCAWFAFKCRKTCFFCAGTRKLDCNIVMAVTILRSMHSNILDIDISNRPGLPGKFRLGRLCRGPNLLP